MKYVAQTISRINGEFEDNIVIWDGGEEEKAVEIFYKIVQRWLQDNQGVKKDFRLIMNPSDEDLKKRIGILDGTVLRQTTVNY